MLKKVFSFKKLTVSVAAIGLAFTIMQNAAAQDTAFAIVSSKGNYWKDATVSEGGNATVTVNAGQTYQTFKGFAGTFNEAGWDALKELSQEKIDEAINLLFNKEDGIGFQWGRIPIGASDYANDRYSLCDASSDDFTMSKFSVERDKNNLMQYIKAAQAVKSDIKFWASPWTPPPWMKKKGSTFDAAGFDGGDMRNESNVFDAYALYFSKFIEAYTAEGIPIKAVCPQNEPGYARSYPTCGWGAYNYDNGKGTSGNKEGTEYLSTFVANHLYKKLQSDHPETEIWFGTLSNNATFNNYWNGMKAKASNGMIKGLGFQWNNVDRVSENANAGYFVFCSEHQCGNYYWESKVSSVEQADSVHFLPNMAPNNFSYGVESWGLMKKWIANGTHLYSAWNMVLDTKGINLNTALEWPQNALLVVDRNAKTLTATPYYYAMRHIGQYVEAGATRIGINSNDALAFKNPNNSIVAIIYNAGGQKEMTVSAGGKNVKFTHPGQGWATVYVGPPPVKAIKGLNQNHITKNADGLRITTMKDGYRISLSSQAAGHIDLLTPAGRVLASRTIAKGSKEVILPRQSSHTGLLIVRAVTGNTVKTAQIMAY